MTILDKKPQRVPQIASCLPKLLKAQQLLENAQFAAAQKLLE